LKFLLLHFHCIFRRKYVDKALEKEHERRPDGAHKLLLRKRTTKTKNPSGEELRAIFTRGLHAFSRNALARLLKSAAGENRNQEVLTVVSHMMNVFLCSPHSGACNYL